MILHIPHASKNIPAELRDQFLLTDVELAEEHRLLTDAFTDELFVLPGATRLQVGFSRLVIDVERFPEDDEEPMSSVGMGRVYTRTVSGQNLRRALSTAEDRELLLLYNQHHRALHQVVENELQNHGQALIVDCHSFSDRPLACDRDQNTDRPDFCIGTDIFHTPEALGFFIQKELRKAGFRSAINAPFAGTIVPMAHYQVNPAVCSVMIEVNRRLYLNEATGEKAAGFDRLRYELGLLLEAINHFRVQCSQK